MESRRARGGGLLALGWALALEGTMAKLSLAVAGLIVLGGVVTAIVIARGDHPEALADVPLVASSALAWGAGTLLAFAASAHAFRRDRERGIRALVSARARSDSEYLAARVIGLARVVAAVTVVGTLVSGFAATLAARGSAVAVHVLGSTVAAVTFSVAFAAVIAPVGFATLGARSRVGGYLALVTVLVVPELLEGPLTRIMPEGWGELASIPGVLLALRSSLGQTTFDPLRLMRAAALIALIVLVAMVVVRGQLARFDREQTA
jgi:hypothetical protein